MDSKYLYEVCAQFAENTEKASRRRPEKLLLQICYLVSTNAMVTPSSVPGDLDKCHTVLHVRLMRPNSLCV